MKFITVGCDMATASVAFSYSVRERVFVELFCRECEKPIGWTPRPDLLRLLEECPYPNVLSWVELLHARVHHQFKQQRETQ
jgi:hypothetical protein